MEFLLKNRTLLGVVFYFCNIKPRKRNNGDVILRKSGLNSCRWDYEALGFQSGDAGFVVLIPPNTLTRVQIEIEAANSFL